LGLEVLPARGLQQPPRSGTEHGRKARAGNRGEPRRTDVATGAEGMRNRERPREVREPVDAAPEARPQAAARETCQHERSREIERDRAESDPERLPRGGERHDDRNEPDMGVRIRNRGDDVQRDECHREERDASMQSRRHETRTVLRPPAFDRRDAEQHDAGEEHEGGDAARAHGVPDRPRALERVRREDHDPPDDATGGNVVCEGGVNVSSLPLSSSVDPSSVDTCAELPALAAWWWPSARAPAMKATSAAAAIATARVTRRTYSRPADRTSAARFT